MKIYYDTKRYIEEVIKGGQYSFLFKYPVVIDIGANIGTFSFWIYDHCDKIYALEPVRENCNNFKKTIQKNHLDKIQLFEEAIACNTGTRDMRMIRKPGEGAWRITDPTGRPEEYRQVKAITLREFMDREGIAYADLVKMDIEGAEREVFDDPTFPFDRVGTIICEFHHGNLGEKKEGYYKGILERNGFTYYEVSNKFLARKK